jgi:hypothetical protein
MTIVNNLEIVKQLKYQLIVYGIKRKKGKILTVN